MDKSAIKNFAINARKKLKEQIEQKAYALGVTKNEIKKPVVHEDTFEVNGNKYEKRTLKHRYSLENKIKVKGFDLVIEEVAYTWFNRLIAIRFMEVNEYLPTGVRVLSSTNPNKAEPDVIREVLNIDLDLNQDLVYKLQDENKTEELFKYILIKQCNELGKIMPVVFEEIEDYTELLLPDNLLQEGSIIRDLVISIVEDDWKEQVEIIGWLYQYYISEKKDEVFEGLKKNIKITKENIPAATQLFTPDWIVKYMVENSLGRLWIESHNNEELKSKWEYFLEPIEQDESVKKLQQKYKSEYNQIRPEQIRIFDPCMGSGHILVYVFDVLFDIYRSSGYSEREIPKLILENNIYGLDIDDRASQLSYFAVLMKARSYNRRILKEKINLNVFSIQESNQISKQAIDFFVNFNNKEEKDNVCIEDVEYIVNCFSNAKETGSIIELDTIDIDSIEKQINQLRNYQVDDLFEIQFKNILLKVLPPLIRQARIMNIKYDVVVTNPPYIGNKGINENLKKYISDKFPDVKADIFAVFIKRCFNYAKKCGHIGMMTPFVWMFISTYESLRKYLVNDKSITSLIQLEYSGFSEATVPICTFTLRNTFTGETGEYVKLSDFKGAEIQPIKTREAVKNRKVNYRYSTHSGDFRKINGMPIAYWASDRLFKVFDIGVSLKNIAEPKSGMTTADNDRFVRLWSEVEINKIGFNFDTRENAKQSLYKWFPYNKGGKFRKWYGNNTHIVNWENDGYEIRNFKGASIRNQNYYFKPGITWTDISSSNFGVRFSPVGFLFCNSGSTVFSSEDKTYYLMALLASKVTFEILKILNPTMHFEVGNISDLPTIIPKDNKIIEYINRLSLLNIEIIKEDWDNFETSWEFVTHPLITHRDGTKLICEAIASWDKYTQKRFLQLKSNEEELNKIFINLYGLDGDISVEVNEEDLTIRRADKLRDIKSFISYCVGCMFGRFSLDEKGLIFAGGEFNSSRYETYHIDCDNVIPLTDDEYFEDDIVSRFVEFIKITFGSETLETNLDFIADTLGKKINETSRQTIRRYFIKDFYKDHLQTYQKKPIYWLFDSGKNDGFKALIYMHRYSIGNVARVRTDYLHSLQRKYEAEVNRLDMLMESNTSTREKNEARKKKEKIQKQIEECKQYDEVIAHVANQKISIDLDDGVSVNYAKFQGVEVPQGEGRKPLKADLLAKI